MDSDGVLSPNEIVSCYTLLREFDHVFVPTIPRYNGAMGLLEGVVNMCPVQPP